MKHFFAMLALLCAFTAAPDYLQSNAAQAASGDTHVLGAVLRPNANGTWYIQVDSTHARKGIDTYVEQPPAGVRIWTCCVATFTKAISISIQSDDGFGDAGVTGTVNGLGYNTATIEIRVHGVKIDPDDICSYVTSCGSNGNFFVTMFMME